VKDGCLTREWSRRAAELKQSAGKKPVCSFGLATNRNRITKSGKVQEVPDYHRIVAWDKLAVTYQQYLCKGRKVYIEGRLQTRSFAGKDGAEKSATEIVVEELVLLDSMPQAVREALEFQSTH
jgi:single-strand DNA-binding protein